MTGDVPAGVARIARIRREITADPENATFTQAGWQPVFSAHPAARILIIGQAPGRVAQDSAVAFSDASGRTLREWLGVEEEVFRGPQLAVLPMDFYYPGRGRSGDRPPRRGFAARWHPPLLAEMRQVHLTVLVGRYAQQYYLGPTGTLTETVRRFADYLPESFPLVHPSPLNFRWQARNPWFATEAVPALRRAVAQALAQ